jgi:hypothetical protein
MTMLDVILYTDRPTMLKTLTAIRKEIRKYGGHPQTIFRKHIKQKNEHNEYSQRKRNYENFYSLQMYYSLADIRHVLNAIKSANVKGSYAVTIKIIGKFSDKDFESFAVEMQARNRQENARKPS